jgi:hypothetical protein
VQALDWRVVGPVCVVETFPAVVDKDSAFFFYSASAYLVQFMKNEPVFEFAAGLRLSSCFHDVRAAISSMYSSYVNVEFFAQSPTSLN